MKKNLIKSLIAIFLLNNIIFSTPVLASSKNYINSITNENIMKNTEKIQNLKTPVIQYNVNKDFNGTNDFIDISENIDKVKDLSVGTFVIKFKTTENSNQTLFTMSDKNDSNSYFEVKLQNGKIRLETIENGQNLMSYTAHNISVNDDKYHTIVISGGELGGIMYVDGEKIVDFPDHTNKFMSLVNTPNSMTIGNKVTNSGESSYFKGTIEYVEVYDTQFNHENSSRFSKNDYREILKRIHGKNKNNIVFAGDSITHGIHHLKGYRSYSEHFNERLRGEEIGGILKNDSFVINTGVSSATTKDCLRGFNTWVETYNPDIVFLTFGMNDCTAMSVNEYKENLKTLVNKVRELGAIPIIQTINTTNGSRENELPPFMEGARDVSKELDVFLIDHNKYWSDLGKDITNPWMGDAIHPNETGHLELVKLIFRELQLDTEDSYTNKLTYPLEGDGYAKPIVENINYPNYSMVEGVKPLTSYKINREFYGKEYIDRSDDINKIKNLNKGSIVTRFNLTSGSNAQTILSLSDSTDPSKEVAVGINGNGTIFLNGRTDNGVVNFTTSKNGYNDGSWHTLVMNFEENGIGVYVDGEKIHSVSNKIFFSSLNNPTHLSIGRNIDNESGQWFFNGAISFIDIYEKVLNEEEIKNISPKVEAKNEFNELRNKILEDGIGNSWVLLGDNSTSGKGSTYGYKNYTEYIEERIRWELRGSLMINRERFMINSAVNGATSTDILNNFNDWATEFEPEIISIMIGSKENVSVDLFEQNLREIISKSKEIGASILLQTPVLSENNIEDFVNVILKVGKEENIPVVDHYNTWKEIEKNNPHLREVWLNEKGEPNHRGHLRIAQEIMKALNIFDSNSLSGGGRVDMKYEDSEYTEELKSTLKNLITECNKTIDENSESSYDEDLKKALVGDIDAATREFNKVDANSKTLNNAIKYLKNSLESFKASLAPTNPDSIFDINKDGTINIGDLSIVSKNIGIDENNINWEKVKICDVNKDKIIDNKDVQAVMEKIIQ
ncbi:GDSL-type esterase/lipase family protein [Clostridium tarantellae]|uniref:Laminin G domain-containing protein n=1 Tax=Clostridium tarantellae TaxID=39493 RepID=A0A6I1MQK0_9CLOT|nr:GDSL-type esterase/lipase family protein [Clostridium tarantellae]MPQ44532.1 hypothetical protein [Clostridium tarantellae]